MIKLIALDIDDTLTKQPTVMPDYNVRAVKRAQDAGIFVTVATGRGFLGSSYAWKQLNIQGPVINYGGSLINDTRTGKSIYTTEIPDSLVHDTLDLAASLNIHSQLYQGDSIVFEQMNEYGKRYVNMLSLPYIVDAKMRKKYWSNVPKVLFITEKERAKELIPMLSRRYDGLLKVSGSSPGFIEFNVPYAHKGSGLKWLADSMGIAQNEVAAAGDSLLDVEMLEWAGLGAAMGDAHDEAKNAADIITPDCEKGGVAWLINKILADNT